jgi:hypothetical protein
MTFFTLRHLKKHAFAVIVFSVVVGAVFFALSVLILQKNSDVSDHVHGPLANEDQNDAQNEPVMSLRKNAASLESTAPFALDDTRTSPSTESEELDVDTFSMNQSRSVDEWIDALVMDVTDERIIELPSTLLDTLTHAARAQDSIYYQFLDIYASLPRSEKKLFFQRILEKGTQEQRAFAVERLFYSENQQDKHFALSLTFALDNTHQRVQVIQNVFTTGSEPALVNNLLSHLANNKHAALVDTFSQDLYQLYTHSSQPEIKHKALGVLLKHAKQFNLNVSELLAGADTEEARVILEVARELIYSDHDKLGGLNTFRYRLKEIATNPNQDDQTIALANELLSIQF